MLILEGFERYPVGAAANDNGAANTGRYDAFNWDFENAEMGAAYGAAEIVGTEYARGGIGRALRMSNQQTASGKYAPYTKFRIISAAEAAAVSKFTVGFWLKPISSVVAFGYFPDYTFSFDTTAGQAAAGQTNRPSIGCYSDGTMRIGYATTLGSWTQIASNIFGNWFLIEIQCDVNASTVVCFLNGQAVASLPGSIASTMMNDAAVDSGLGVFFRPPMYASMDTGQAVCDDFYYHDNRDGHSGEPLGKVKVHTLYPATADQSQFAPVGAATNLDAVTDGDDATYVTSDTAGAKDLYSYDYTPTGDAVVAVQASSVARATGSAATMAQALGVPGNLATQTVALTAGDAAQARHQISTTNPATGLPWTEADLTTLQTGYGVAPW